MKSNINLNGALSAISNGIIQTLESEYKPFILSEVKSRTPEDTGKLKDSERVDIYKSGNLVICEVSANTEYAKIQHEMPNYLHKTGESGYILNPMIESVDEVTRMLANGIGKKLSGGARK